MIFFLIDDDPIFQFITDKTLKRINPQVVVEKYADGEEGINCIKSRLSNTAMLPDVVLLDINMPFMNGWQFLKEYNNLSKDIDKNIQIYMLTSSDDPEDVEKAKKFSELSGYLIKPITELELEVLIREFPIKTWYQPNC
ncbi:Response regulator receiver domain-containing protein [Gillisia sp. Hel1_33_143]|uniref:response regulator n=1 Tax=unclassified Gillisia TaxID=2615025 RepID=UPI00068EABCD|nr:MULTISPECIES: response regulator [unclassified Gillisia]SDR79121.1 Response regulator receiver domain-containing protein [Gillisia sp. Hel1_33_143]